MRLNPSIVIGLLSLLGVAAVSGVRAEGSTNQRLAALPAPSQATVALGAARPLAAWTEFCQRYRAECAIDLREPETVALSAETWALVGAVNRGVNHEIRAVTDEAHWGVPDRWDLAEDGAGDCEDFQLLKRHRLAAAGLPRRAMRMTVVLDDQNEGHAVLMLRTDRGDLVLDNKTDAVLPWHRTGYTYIKRESADTIAWVSLGAATSPTMTANR